MFEKLVELMLAVVAGAVCYRLWRIEGHRWHFFYQAGKYTRYNVYFLYFISVALLLFIKFSLGDEKFWIFGFIYVGATFGILAGVESGRNTTMR